MCTAITLTTKDGYHLFGRNMDLQYNFNQEVTLVPRNFNYINRATKKEEKTKYAMIGMASIIDNHPCFAEASNEKGLSCAGLNFPKYAHWNDEVIEGKNNLPPYDIILWSLANFGSVKEIREEIEKINIVGSQVNDKVPLPTLHWILADKEGDCIVVENTIEGLKISENNLGVLTNSPPFNWHVTNLSQYIKVTPIQASENYWGDVKINPVGEGEGAKSLPGDFSSPSRFVKIAYLRNNSPKGDDSFIWNKSIFPCFKWSCHDKRSSNYT